MYFIETDLLKHGERVIAYRVRKGDFVGEYWLLSDEITTDEQVGVYNAILTSNGDRELLAKLNLAPFPPDNPPIEVLAIYQED